MKALVASRSPEFRGQVIALLEGCGHEVAGADRGSHLVRQALEEAFDLIVIDTDLAGMDGVESLSVLRRVRPNIPVVVVSEDVSEQVSRQIASEGAFYHFHKPLYEADFLKVVGAIAGQETETEC